MLVGQVVLQFAVLVLLAPREDFFLVDQLGPQLLGDLEVVFLVDDVLHIVLGTFEAEGFDLGSQLLDEPLLDGDFLEDGLVGVICNSLRLHVLGNDCDLRLDLLDLQMQLVVLNDQPPPVFSVLEI